MHNALIIERDSMQRALLTDILNNKLDYNSNAYNDNHQAIKKQHEYYPNNPELIFLDLQSCQPDYLSAIDQCNRLHPDSLLIIMLSADMLPLAARAINQGADQILIKPLSIEQLENTIKQAKSDCYFKKHKDKKSPHYYLIDTNSNKQRIIGDSKHNSKLQEFITKSIKVDLPLFIQGENGSGKTHLAKIIHQLGENREQQFHIIEANKEPKLLQYQLNNIDNGTVYIKISGAINSKQNIIWNKYLNQKHKNIRIIASDIVRPIIIKPNSIRKYFTDNKHIDFNTVPLRERREDILPLAYHFLKQSNQILDKDIQHFSDKAITYLKYNEWKGNICQLRNLIFIAVNSSIYEVLTETDLIKYNDALSIEPNNNLTNNLTSEYNNQQNGKTLYNGYINTLNNSGDIRALKEIEEEIVHYALKYYNGSRSRAARKLGIGRTTLYRKAQLLNSDNNTN